MKQMKKTRWLEVQYLCPDKLHYRPTLVMWAKPLSTCQMTKDLLPSTSVQIILRNSSQVIHRLEVKLTRILRCFLPLHHQTASIPFILVHQIIRDHIMDSILLLLHSLQRHKYLRVEETTLCLLEKLCMHPFLTGVPIPWLQRLQHHLPWVMCLDLPLLLSIHRRSWILLHFL